MAKVFFIPGCTKGNEPPAQLDMCTMSELVLDVYRELKRLRENSYSLNVLVRTFAKSGVVLTTNSLTTYMKSLALPREQPQPKPARTGTVVVAPTVELRTKHFQMKANKLLQERSNVWQGFSS
jgi:hypothetical protein